MLLLWMEPNPRFNLNTKKEKTHYMKRLRKAWSNSQRLHINQWHTVSNRPVKLCTSRRGAVLPPGFESHSKGTKIIWQGLKTAKLLCFVFLIPKSNDTIIHQHRQCLYKMCRCRSVIYSQHLPFLHACHFWALSNSSFLKLYLQHNV